MRYRTPSSSSFSPSYAFSATASSSSVYPSKFYDFCWFGVHRPLFRVYPCKLRYIIKGWLLINGQNKWKITNEITWQSAPEFTWIWWDGWTYYCPWLHTFLGTRLPRVASLLPYISPLTYCRLEIRAWIEAVFLCYGSSKPSFLACLLNISETLAMHTGCHDRDAVRPYWHQGYSTASLYIVRRSL